MTDIEDREIAYRSYKSYAEAQSYEIKLLQQLLPSEKVIRCFEAVKRAIKKGGLKGELIFEEK